MGGCLEGLWEAKEGCRTAAAVWPGQRGWWEVRGIEVREVSNTRSSWPHGPPSTADHPSRGIS